MVVALLVAQSLALSLAVGPAAGPATAQTAPTTTQAETTTSSFVPPGGADDQPSAEANPLPPIGEDQSGSPAVFVILSFVGAAVALAIMAGTWIRTRPD